MNEEKIQWHPGFCAAMRLELKRDAEFLIFTNEYNLNSKPLEIDLLIIKKQREQVIKNIVGKIFRMHNILEYKSPEEELSIDTFYKVNGYACLYKSYGDGTNAIKADDVTVSFVRKGKPVKLLHMLKEHGFTVENPYSGIYYISGKNYFPTQIIVTGMLPKEEHVWLRSLSQTLDRQTARELITQAQSFQSGNDKELADAVLSVSIRANRELFGRLKEDWDMCDALRMLMADELAESKEAGREEGMEKGLKALVSSLKGLLHDADAVYQAVIKNEAYADTTREKVMKYYQA